MEFFNAIAFVQRYTQGITCQFYILESLYPPQHNTINTNL